MSGAGDKLKGKVKRNARRREHPSGCRGEGDVVKGEAQRMAGTVKDAVADIKNTVKR